MDPNSLPDSFTTSDFPDFKRLILQYDSFLQFYIWVVFRIILVTQGLQLIFSYQSPRVDSFFVVTDRPHSDKFLFTPCSCYWNSGNLETGTYCHVSAKLATVSSLSQRKISRNFLALLFQISSLQFVCWLLNLLFSSTNPVSVDVWYRNIRFGN